MDIYYPSVIGSGCYIRFGHEAVNYKSECILISNRDNVTDLFFLWFHNVISRAINLSLDLIEHQ